MSLTLCPIIKPNPHDSAHGDTTLQCVQACRVASKYTRVGLGLFDSTMKTYWVPLVFVYTDWAFVRAVAAAECPQAGHPQAEPVQYLHM
jgi:hypothetical protein